MDRNLRITAEFAGDRPAVARFNVPGWSALAAVALVFILAASLWAAVPPGTVIENTAKATYSAGVLNGIVSLSNSVSVTSVATPQTPAEIEFMRYQPEEKPRTAAHITEYRNTAGVFVALPPPVPFGDDTPLDLTSVPLVNATLYHAGEPFFIKVTDIDENRDPTVQESILLTLIANSPADTEVLRIYETGPSTGVFVGYIPSSALGQPTSGDGVLRVSVSSSIQAVYRDVDDDTDIVADAALVDPYGKVFDSDKGEPANGVVITLLDASTGGPATVYGDDGISIYPSTVTSGGTATDSGGNTYTFEAGSYRFPLIAPGEYRLSVEPPRNKYRWPSQVSDEDLQNLPNAPFALVPASRGEPFRVVNFVVRIDVPVDPIRSLYLTKTAAKSVVAIGDFLQYKLTVENTSANDISGVVVSDRLPLGFRYRKGSAKIDGTALTPAALEISDDGRTLQFSAGALAAEKIAGISYVVEVAAGAKLGDNTNVAVATGAGGSVVSNEARATVKVREDLFASKSFIMGRVSADGCDPAADGGVSGIRIYMEDGAYVITDKQGMFHFEGVTPGTHIVQLDLETVPEEYELLSCDANNRTAVPYSQFVDVQGGAMWRADFYLALKPKPEPPLVPVEELERVEIKGEAAIELRSALISGEKDNVLYTASVHVSAIALKNLRLYVMLPEGARYVGQSADNALAKPGDVPVVTDDIVVFRLGDTDAEREMEVKFTASVPVAGREGELATKAFLAFDGNEIQGLRTPTVENLLRRAVIEQESLNPDVVLHPHFDVLSAELKAADRAELDNVIDGLRKQSVMRIYVIGHTDSTPIRKGNKLYADNYALSLARAQSVAKYIGDALGLAPEQVRIEGYGPDKPVASNSTKEGRSENRRVELTVVSEGSENWIELHNVKDRSEAGRVEIVDARKFARVVMKRQDEVQREAAEKAAREKGPVAPPAPFTQEWVEGLPHGFDWILPEEGFYPTAQSIKIAVKHGGKVRVMLNGEEVNPVYFDGALKSADGRLMVSLWNGVNIGEGDNLIEAVELEEGGLEAGRIERKVHFSTPPVKAEVMEKLSNLVADGKTPPVIALRLTDSDGHPAREGSVGEFTVEPPYMTLEKALGLEKNPLAASTNERSKYVVEKDGMVFIRLEPTPATGVVVLKVGLADGMYEMRRWLKPEERDWILVGLAEGTAGYNVVSGNMESAGAADMLEDSLYDEGRLAFFAKGRIKGRWLLTLAYDSSRGGKADRQALHRTIDPDTYYSVYGDASEQRYDAPSARSLYVKIEREGFYALFGDYETGLTVTELSRYNRSFNGLKAEGRAERYDFTVFGTESEQVFVRDEIRGDGTSGLYRLSRKDIVLNSESVIIETRDRFHSEAIISSQKLNRHIDYNIDYDAGTIYFKSPVYSSDERFNPVFIVIEYETFDTVESAFVYGGRGAVHSTDRSVEAGATFVSEDRGQTDGTLAGLDVNVKVGGHTTVKGEVASTSNDIGTETKDGSAYIAEVSHRAGKIEGAVYVRRQDGGFGLGGQRGSEAGTRKLGANAAYQLTSALGLSAEAYRDYNLQTDAVRDVGTVQSRYAWRKYTFNGGLRHAEDSFENGEDLVSDQLIVGASTRQMNDRLTLKVNHEQSIINNENNTFPTRTSIGADYKIRESVMLFGAQEFTWGEAESTESTRIGVSAEPWTDGQISSTVEEQRSENATRLFATTGLKQTWKLTEKFSVDGGLDRSSTLRESANSPTVTPGQASGDYTAVSLGASYAETKWAWTGRLEGRDSEAEDKVIAFTGINGEPRKGLGLAAGLRTLWSEQANGAVQNNADLRLGLAYRPAETDWIVLDRLDFIVNEQKTADFSFDNWRIVNNMNANWRPMPKAQLSLQYGAKYVSETIDDKDYSGYTDLTGIEGRYDITNKIDMGLRGGVLHSWSVGQMKYLSGVSVGYGFAKNVWVSVGYNFSGFRDADFSKADFTGQGPFIKFRMRFDQSSARSAVKWLAARN